MANSGSNAPLYMEHQPGSSSGMSTSYDPAGSQQYVDFDEYVDYQLQRTREQIR